MDDGLRPPWACFARSMDRLMDNLGTAYGCTQVTHEPTHRLPHFAHIPTPSHHYHQKIKIPFSFWCATGWGAAQGRQSLPPEAGRRSLPGFGGAKPQFVILFLRGFGAVVKM